MITTANGAGSRFILASSISLASLAAATLAPAAPQSIANGLLDTSSSVEASSPPILHIHGWMPTLGEFADDFLSAPVLVGEPSLRYPDRLEPGARYSEFKSRLVNRDKTIYVGATDGRLHAINAATGTEQFTYVPSLLTGGLADLASTEHSPRYCLSSSPTIVDAYIEGSWRTVLAAGLNNGGQGIYALDVTHPSNLTESIPADLALWEFTDADDPDLGYIHGQPAIVKLQNGVWAGVFGNGYNNTAADANPSTTGNAVLYVVDLRDGNLIKKLDTGAGIAYDPTGQNQPNGLATVAAVDLDGDFVADAIYAGDLFGNLWKFDFSGPTVASWTIAHGGAPLFTACGGSTCTTGISSNRQPITTRPTVGRHPTGTGVLVYFGTGKHLDAADSTTTDLQSFYALWDAGEAVSGRDSLLSQSITHEFSTTVGDAAFELRATTNNAVDWAVHKGWYLDLVSPFSGNQGERQITNAVLRSNRIIFTTAIPGSTPCTPGGQTWLMELDARTGARLSHAPFDLDRNGRFTTADHVTVTIAGVPTTISTSGMKMPGGSASAPIVVPLPDSEVKCMSTSAGMTCIPGNPGPRDTGRQSWRQLGR